jgi:hypothetical protein
MPRLRQAPLQLLRVLLQTQLRKCRRRPVEFNQRRPELRQALRELRQLHLEFHQPHRALQLRQGRPWARRLLRPLPPPAHLLQPRPRLPSAPAP